MSVKLSKAAFRKLRRAKRLSLMAVVKAKGPVGKARVTKRKLAVSAPKPVKKKKRAPSKRQAPARAAPAAAPRRRDTTLRDGQYKGNSAVSFKVEGGRVKGFFGFVPIFCSKLYGNGLSHFDTAGQAFVAADDPAIIMPSRTFSGTATNSYRHYSYEGQFIGDGST